MKDENARHSPPSNSWLLLFSLPLVLLEKEEGCPSSASTGLTVDVNEREAADSVILNAENPLKSSLLI